MDEARPDVVKKNTKFSELGTPPEQFHWWTPLGYLVAIFLTGLLLVPLLLFSPVILLLMTARHMRFRRVQYHKDPAGLRIAVIGGGWSGLGCGARLLELGVKNVRIFERYDDVGGTWNPNLRYHGLQLHAAMWMSQFDKFPYSSEPDVQRGKARGDEVLCYMKRFVHERGLKEHITLSSKVSDIKLDSTTRTGTLVVEDSVSGERREEGPFDLIIYASFAAFPKVPQIQGSELFQGKQYHTTEVQTADFDTIREKGQQVVVVGGSKAGCDMVLNFKRASYDNLTWLFRTPYLFWKYEVIGHDGCSVFNMIRGATTIAALLWSAICMPVAGLIFWCNGACCTVGRAHNDWNKFSYGVLCARQRRDLSDVPQTIGEPVRLLAKGMELQDGTTIGCDTIIWATGNANGIDKVRLEKDGKPFILQDSKLFNHFIVPQFPVFASSTAFFTTFGPLRGGNAADMAVYHLCVRRELSPDEMERDASWNISKNSAIAGFLWTKAGEYVPTLRTFVLTDVDLVLRGIIALEDLLWHIVEMFVLGRQKAVRLDILPKANKNKDM